MTSRIYVGDVVHKRVRPRAHALRYHVFALAIDVDEIDAAATRLRWFSHNRFNLFSLWDRDHGASGGVPLGVLARQVLSEAGIDSGSISRIELLAYPRVLGYVFNPLAVYFARDAAGALVALIYEVRNTFGDRIRYVLPAGPAVNGVHSHACAKAMPVSPFAPPTGRYDFHITPPDAQVVVGVAFRDGEGPLIKTHFRGQARPLDDTTLLRLAVRFPLLTVKVMAAIHWEALKLWLKGVPVIRRQRSPRRTMT